jgi:peptidoglycan/xylan/chitin deacetylase (PgdA/CDA1 family)
MASRRTSPGRRKNQRRSPGKLILYPLAIAAGAWAGMQGYAAYQKTLKPEPRVTHVRREDVPADRPTDTRRSDSSAETRSRDERRDEPSELPGGGEPSASVAAASGDWERFPAMEVDRAMTGRPEVALTFDAGADWKPAKQILDALESEKVKCTFFLTGEWVRENPRTTRRIVEEGHEIGNHSWDHPDLTRLSDDQVRDQLDRTESAVKEATGRSSRPYFRPPLGARDARVRRIVGEQGYMTIYWTLDSHDSVRKEITPAEIRDRVSKGIDAGSIVLLHCGSQATADAVSGILADLKQRNLKPVPLGRLLPK